MRDGGLITTYDVLKFGTSVYLYRSIIGLITTYDVLKYNVKQQEHCK